MIPQELRIGNWIKYEGNHFPVSGILEEHFYIKLEDGEEYQMYYDDDVSGIPLTPEVLEKCGFEKLQTGDFVIRGKIALRCENGKYYFKFYHKFILIESFHQLQNLFYALTGKEINYKP